jgi:drug/metabolite transporter (DMT)-like permease
LSINQKHLLLASLFVALSGILYGFLGYLGTIILRENIPLSTMQFWRFLFAGSWVFLFTLKKCSIKAMRESTNKRILLFMFILGAVGYGGSSGFYFMASHYTGTALAMVVFFTYPIVVALFSWLLHGKEFTLATIITLLAMMIGLYFLEYTPENSFNLTGILFGMIAAVFYAIYIVGSKRFSSLTIDSHLLVLMVCFGSAAAFLILALVENEFIVPHLWKTWLNLIILAILVTALPIQLMLLGLKYVSSLRASIISVLEPLVTIFVAILLLNESITHLQFIGAVIILGSALIVQFQKEL